MADAIKFVPLFPLLGVIVNALLSGQSVQTRARLSGWIAVTAAALSFVAALVVASGYPGVLGGKAFTDVEVYRWLDFPGSQLSIPVAFRIDGLSLLMTLIVTGVGTLIHIFSVSYMKGDPRFGRFFIYLNLFLFSMLLLVLANNYVLMFVGWEGVGLCSYLLIGYYFEKVSAAQAGKKAFLINRVGDFGMLLGMFALFSLTGSLVFNTPEGTGALDQAASLNGMKVWGLPAVTFICVCFFLACTGKSAQLPLHVWLPDAMEGPTPVSALIHAATMVTAGVYLVARSAALFGQSQFAQMLVVTVGTLTAIWAAVVAVKQYDIKRVLAYSTVSQLGFMFAGVGSGAYAAGVSHLATHAFFKALMFLGAGAVMHALEGQLDMRKMGNMKRHMPVTYWTFAIGWFCICGLPPGSGFFSKDLILEGVYHHGYPIHFWVLVFTAGLTAFYMSRMFFTVFWGSERIEMGDEGHGHDSAEDIVPSSHTHGHGGHGREHAGYSPAVKSEADHGHSHGGHGHGHGHRHVHVHPESPLMNIPLIALAVLSIVGAAVVFRLPGLIYAVTQGMVPATGGHGAGEHATPHYPGVWHFDPAALLHLPTIAGFLAGVTGVVAALAMRKQFERGWDRSTEKILDAHDRAYEGTLHAIFVRGGQLLSNVLFSVVDRAIIDNLVNGTATFVDYLAESLRTLQTGYVRNYALVMLAGAVFVVACFMLILQQLSSQQWLEIFKWGAPVLAVVLIGGFLIARRTPTSAE